MKPNSEGDLAFSWARSRALVLDGEPGATRTTAHNERHLLEEKASREREWKSGEMDVLSEVDEEEIAEVLSAWTGIPVFKLTEEETEKLLRMEDELHKRIVDQEEALTAVSKSIRRTRAGLKDPKR